MNGWGDPITWYHVAPQFWSWARAEASCRDFDFHLRTMVEGSLHCILQLDIGLGSWQDLAHTSDNVVEEVLVQGVRTCNPLMNAVQKYPHCSWGISGVGFERSWYMIWHCRYISSWRRGYNGFFSWPLREMHTEWGTLWLPLRNCRESGVAENRTNPMLHL